MSGASSDPGKRMRRGEVLLPSMACMRKPSRPSVVPQVDFLGALSSCLPKPTRNVGSFLVARDLVSVAAAEILSGGGATLGIRRHVH
jgi:hypothetical protein